VEDNRKYFWYLNEVALDLRCSRITYAVQNTFSSDYCLPSYARFPPPPPAPARGGRQTGNWRRGSGPLVPPKIPRGLKPFFFRFCFSRFLVIPPPPPAHVRWAKKQVAVSSCKVSVITVRVHPKLQNDDNVINPHRNQCKKKISWMVLGFYVYGRTDGQADADDLTDTFSRPFVSSTRNLSILEKIQVSNIYRVGFLLDFFITFRHLNHFPFISLCSTFIYSSLLSINGGRKSCTHEYHEEVWGSRGTAPLFTKLSTTRRSLGICPDRLIFGKRAPAVIE